jgi:hypothetical protein
MKPTTFVSIFLLLCAAGQLTTSMRLMASSYKKASSGSVIKAKGDDGDGLIVIDKEENEMQMSASTRK